MCNCHKNIFTKRIGNRREAFALLMGKIVRVYVIFPLAFVVKLKRYMRNHISLNSLKVLKKRQFLNSKNCSKVICGYCI